MTPQTTPVRLSLKRDEKLEIDWEDGRRSVYPIVYLRSMCPCAQCKITREARPEAAPASAPGAAPGEGGEKKKSLRLSVLPGNYAAPLSATGAERVGNYALRIDWSDGHGSGIYSFQYLREISPQRE
jgi:DUF971 family protein